MDFLKRPLALTLRPITTDEDVETLLKTDEGGASFSTRYAFPPTASRAIRRIVIALLSIPIERRLAPHLYKPSRIHPTSYLDGLRGMYLGSFDLLSLLPKTTSAKC